MKALCLLAALCCSSPCFAQEPAVFDDNPMQERALNVAESEYVLREPTGLAEVEERVEPPNWYVGMKEPTFEVMIYRRDVAAFKSATVDHPGLSVDYVNRLANPNYLFVGLRMAGGTPAGKFNIVLRAGMGRSINVPYELRSHPGGPEQALSQQDLIYLIMPDRFANGDPTNDAVPGMRDSLVNRNKFFFRHGGDLKGIEDKLGYLEDLGVTAIWLNPVLENDQPYASYHGYAVTDHYRIDRRFGTNEAYKSLVTAAKKRGIKVIMDVIFNHVGDQHFFIRDLPSEDWIHQWPEYTKTTYRATTLLDPHASDYDRKLMLDGWFDKHMPDLNQRNPHLARYLIQNSIWWTLYSGQSGFRLDTYAYSDPDFMAEWNRRMLAEFPNIGIFGETWVHGPGVQSWFAGGRGTHQEFDSHLPGVTDFQTYYAIHEALARDPGWTDGVLRLYYTLAQDYLYADPTKNVLFLDNHDIARIFTSVERDKTKMKSALALLMTLRGIPMLYYGTELALEGSGGAFGEGGRLDFPGGFPGDTTDVFNPAERTTDQREIFNYTSQLANFRKSSPALAEGSFRQFVPIDGVYAYFRESREQTVMVLFNANAVEMEGINTEPYREILGGYRGAREIGNAAGTIENFSEIDLKPKEVRVFELN